MESKTKEDPLKKHESKIAELKQAHGELVCFDARGQLFAFRRPSLDEFENWQHRNRSGEQYGVVARELCQLCNVFPGSADGTHAELNKVFQRAPRVATEVSDSLVSICGDGIEVVVKKD